MPAWVESQLFFPMAHGGSPPQAGTERPSYRIGGSVSYGQREALGAFWRNYFSASYHLPLGGAGEIKRPGRGAVFQAAKLSGAYAV